MPKLPHNELPSLDNFEANDSEREINHKTKELVERKKASGNTAGRTCIICDGGKTKFYVHPKADVNERLEHYKNIYPDAKIKL